MTARISASADVDPRAVVGDGTAVWHLAQVREGAILGRDCVVGRGAYVGPGVHIADAVKVQNFALVYEPATIDSGAFIGPAAVLTNDLYPRAVDPDGTPKRAGDWTPVAHVRAGASVGACAVCVAPVSVGRWAMPSRDPSNDCCHSCARLALKQPLLIGWVADVRSIPPSISTQIESRTVSRCDSEIAPADGQRCGHCQDNPPALIKSGVT